MTVRTNKSEIDIRAKLTELDRPNTIAGNEFLNQKTVKDQQEHLGVGRRNQIINGDFSISQRGDYAGGFTAVEATYFVDRWRTRTTGSPSATCTHTLNKVRLEVNTTIASASVRIDQKIEIRNSSHLSNKIMTLSAWVKSNSSDARIAVYHQGWEARNTQHSGDGEWEHLTLTFNTGALVASNEFSIQIGLDGPVSANVALTDGEYFEVMEVQLEFGDTASPFERRTFGEELALCQRYYVMLAAGADYDERYAGGSSHILGTMHKWNTTNTFVFTDLPVSMRNSNNMTLKVPPSSSNAFAFKSGGYTATGNGLSLDGDSSNRSIRLNTALTNSSWALGCSGWVRCNQASAYCALDCEL